MKKITKSNKGLRGRRVRIEPEKSDSILATEDNSVIARARVIEAGPESLCKKGDTIIFATWLIDKIDINGTISYYILDTDDSVFEIL